MSREPAPSYIAGCRSRQLMRAYWTGFNARRNGQSYAECPYLDVRDARGHVTYSRAYRRAWLAGWEDAAIHTDAQERP